MVATDFNGIRDRYYSGQADILGFPVTREPRGAYTPLEQMPESAQALYRHDPEKARALLTEAGYPDGFTGKVVFWNGADFPDLASVLKEMWAKAGIDLILEPKELGAFTTIAYSKSYEDLILTNFLAGSEYPNCLGLSYFKGASFGHVNDAVINAASGEIQRHVIIDMPEAERLFRKLIPYVVDQAYHLPLPGANACSLWWPWLKNCHGETPIQFAKYRWIDRDLSRR
jgi:peptide/nickel transport system substrate-binding protein